MDDARPEDVVPGVMGINWIHEGPPPLQAICQRVAWCESAIERLTMALDCECDCHTVPANIDSEWLDRLRNRLQYGFSVSLDEQRALFQLATGQTAQPNKRCHVCNGEGRVMYGRCSACDGEGYVHD